MDQETLAQKKKERLQRERQIHDIHAKGDLQRSAEEALEFYGREISGWLYRRHRSYDTTIEMYSNFCFYFWLWLPTFNWQSSLRTWMYSIARKVCYRKIPTHHDPLSQVSQNVSALIVNQNQRISTYKYREAEDALKALSDRLLCDEEKDLLIWRVDRQMSWQDIARILSDEPILDCEECNKQATALRVRFTRIKKKLREAAECEALVRQDVKWN